MRRQRTRRAANGIQLFPFLAVLICAMGALIVLLVLVVQQARVRADTIRTELTHRQQARAADEQKLIRQQEDLDWQREVLEQQRQELAQKLADRRLELSHLEDHIRRLEQRWKSLVAEAEDLQRSPRDRASPDDAAAQQELARLRAAIDTEQQRLAAARQEAAARKRSFAIVPYPGPQGTRRRPIYVECREDAIVLQPEGVVLRPEDFQGPLGPGNPLDAALRAIREHWARADGNDAGEPYPLLVVRPGGSVAYGMARAAMAAWDSEFGYELVEGDVQLRYPPADPAVQQLLQGTLATARQRQAILAAAMPARFSRDAGERFALPDNYTRDVAAMVQEGEPGGGIPAARPAGGTATGIGPGGPPRLGRGPGGEGLAPPGGTPPMPVAATGPATADGSASAAHSDPATSGRSAAASTADATTAGRSTPRSPPGRPASASTTGDKAAGGTPGSGPSAAGATGMAGQSAGGSSAAGGAALQAMAAHKGNNWALCDAPATSVGITRPLAVECYPDRLVIPSERGDPVKPHVTRFKGSTADSVEKFVSGVWDRIDSWGIAVANGYWKPVLRIRVYPGAESRFSDLQLLLKDSGLVVERRE